MTTMFTAESLAYALLAIVGAFLVALISTVRFPTKPQGQQDSGFHLFAKRRSRRGLVLLALLALGVAFLFWRQTPSTQLESTSAQRDATPAPETRAPELPGSVAQAAAAVGDMPTAAATQDALSGYADAKVAVAAAVEAWRAAWSARDVATYLEAYAPNFQPADGLALGDWQQQRKYRLRKARGIRVAVEQLSIEIEGERAVARFLQHYRAGSVSDRVWKRLVLARTSGVWKITEEALDRPAKE